MKQNRVVCLPGHALLVFIFRSYLDFRETGPRALFSIGKGIKERERIYSSHRLDTLLSRCDENHVIILGLGIMFLRTCKWRIK